MKNIEKHPNTEDALEEYKRFKDGWKYGAPPSFEEWCGGDYVPPHPPTLIGVAREILSRIDSGYAIYRQEDIENLREAVRCEEAKGLRNCDVMTEDELVESVEGICRDHRKGGDSMTCTCSGCELYRIGTPCVLLYALMPYSRGVDNNAKEEEK